VELRSSVGTCWTSEFVADGTSANLATRFKAKAR
jgi:hypothetical protein